MKLLYGKPFAEMVQRNLHRRVFRMQHKPSLAVVLVGSDPASVHYVNRKGLVGKAVGCGFAVLHLPASVPQTRVEKLIRKLNKNRRISGIIVQLPLPAKLDTPEVLAAIAPEKDVDNLRGDSPFLSPSVQAIWHLLGKAVKPRRNTKILVVGYGRLIGKPLHAFLLKKGFMNVKVADKTTRNLQTLTARADIIISAVGKPGLIKKVKKGAIVIDAGAGLKNGKIKGDVDIAKVSRLAKAVTPVPGGVGPLTVVYLFNNLLRAGRFE